MTESPSVRQMIDEVVRLWLAESSSDVLVRRLCEMMNDPNQELARDYLRQIVTGYQTGRSIGGRFVFSGVATAGSSLYLAGFERGYWAGTKHKLLFKILPICVAVVTLVAIRMWG